MLMQGETSAAGKQWQTRAPEGCDWKASHTGTPQAVNKRVGYQRAATQWHGAGTGLSTFRMGSGWTRGRE